MKFQLLPTIAYLCLLSLLLALSFWQFNRAEEKRIVLMLQESNKNTETLLLSDRLAKNFELDLYKRTKAEGHFDKDHQYLLDNQINQGKVGYFVLTPFLIKDEQAVVLVNRGWLPLGKKREELPNISVGDEKRIISGRINRFSGIGIKLKGAEIPTKTWPALIQVVDIEVLSQHLGYKLLPFQVELDQDAAGGYKRDWHTPLAMPPEQHIAYAVQWFLLAITLTLLFFKYGRHKNHEQT